MTDPQRRLVADLNPNDFELVDNDRAQPLTFFVRDVQPVTVVALLDASASMNSRLTLLRRAAREFTGRLLPDDRARIGAFGDEIEFSPEFTNDRGELANAIDRLDADGGTRLYDALLASLDALRGVSGRRVILVFSDGDDTQSKASLKKVVERAVAQEVMVYGIGLDTPAGHGKKTVNDKPDAALKRLADETGGGYFALKSNSDLVPAFAHVAEELHSQYVLGFEPLALDGRVHKLEVRLRRPGMTARARRSYVAERVSSTKDGL